MRLKLRCPAETAVAIAAASAQIVDPSAAFSMMHPVKTVPSAHSIAAPFLSREYGVYEFSIASAADSNSLLSVIFCLLFVSLGLVLLLTGLIQH